MTSDERQAFIKWLKGIPYEIKFWNSYYSHSRSLEALYSWSHYGQRCQLENFGVQDFLLKSGDSPLMLDVGCALSYVLGTQFDNPGVRLHLIDPLAKFYNRILDKAKVDRMRLKEGMAELLSAAYPAGSVDLVHVRNALDHSANPMLGIYEGLHVLRTGGVLYLRHHPNEAERESYKGFHQYNIDCRDGQLIIWNKKNSINVSETLAGIAEISCSTGDNQDIIAVITKLKDTPIDKYDQQEAPRRALEMMNLTVAAFNSTNFAISYNFKKFIASIGHPLMRRIPRKFVERLKAITQRQTSSR